MHLQPQVAVKPPNDWRRAEESVVRSLIAAVEARDRYTGGHSTWLGRYAVGIGRRIGLSKSDVATLETGAALHDVGKIVIPDAILLKPGLLTPSEYEVIKQHTVLGERMCGNVRSLAAVKPIVRHHHERLDGSGYPDRLRGSQVPILAQIVGIVDVYDALITDRPYRRALPSDTAREILTDEARRGWRDTVLVQEFIRVLADAVCAA